MKKIISAVLLIVLLISVMGAAVSAATSTSGSDKNQNLKLSLISQTPDPASAGQTVELRFMAENLGGAEIDNIQLQFTPSYPFTKLEGEQYTQTITALTGYQQGSNAVIIKFKVGIDSSAVEGTSQIKIMETMPGATYTQPFDISVTGQKFAQVVLIDKSVLVPGKLDTLTFTITNVGSAPLRDITFSWINDDKVILPVGSDNTKYVKYIGVGESAELEYQTIANTGVDAGMYELTLSLSYSDPVTGTEHTTNTIAGVYVGGGTDFDIAFSESSSAETSFTIANVGSNPATSVSIVVPQQQGWSVTGSNSQIIGNLNTGDYTVASFMLAQSTQGTTQMPGAARQQANASKQSSAQNTLLMQISYTDTMGRREVVTKSVAMNTQSASSATTAASSTSSTTSSAQGPMGQFPGQRSQQSFFSMYKWYIAVLVALIIAGLGFRTYNQKKIENPDFSPLDLLKRDATNSKGKAR